MAQRPHNLIYSHKNPIETRKQLRKRKDLLIKLKTKENQNLPKKERTVFSSISEIRKQKEIFSKISRLKRNFLDQEINKTTIFQIRKNAKLKAQVREFHPNPTWFTTM